MKNLYLFITILSLINISEVYSSDEIKFLTFNTGLYHSYVPNASERLPEVVKALKSYNGDVICLQEVWDEDEMDLIADALKSKYPYAHKSKAKQKKTSISPVCKRSDLFGEEKIVSCFKEKCSNLDGDEFTQCVLSDCEGPLSKLRVQNNQCAQALFAQVGVSPLLGIIRLRNPVMKTGLFSNDGSVGTIIISKHPFVKGSKKSTDMANISTLTHRSILHGDIEIDQKTFHVSCNHTTANLDNEVPYPGPFKNYEEENKVQTEFVIKTAQELGAGKIKVVMGDFNMGAEVPEKDIDADFRDNYLLFEQHGYIDPIQTSPNAACSHCNDNTMLRNFKPRILIDHIFLKDSQEYRTTAKMVFKKQIKISKKPDLKLRHYFKLKRNRPQPEIIDTNLSDHFGVEVTLF